MTDRRNQHGANCRLCGGWVADNSGILETRRDMNSHEVVHRVRHRDGECPAPGEKPAANDAPIWAVHAEGLTPAGNHATGVRLVEAAHRPRDGWALNERARAAEMADSGNGNSVEQLAARTAVGRQWLAYWWLRGIRPKPSDVSMDDLDAMLGDASVDAMDAAVASAGEN